MSHEHHREPWNTIPPDVREQLVRRLTTKQLHVFILWRAGCGYERIGRMLGMSPWSVRQRLNRAKVHYYSLTIKEPQREEAT